jgi:hypothetical protein
MMRAIVVALAVLACAKLGSHAYFYRAATYDIIVKTFKNRALVACADSGARGQFRIPARVWSQPESVALEIGKRALDVPLWQINHQHWHARYKDPYIVVTANRQSASIVCEYDVTRSIATVYGL